MVNSMTKICLSPVLWLVVESDLRVLTQQAWVGLETLDRLAPLLRLLMTWKVLICPEVSLACSYGDPIPSVWTVSFYHRSRTCSRTDFAGLLEAARAKFWEDTTVPQSGETSQKINTPTQDSEVQEPPSALLSVRVSPSSGTGPADKVGVGAHWSLC